MNRRERRIGLLCVSICIAPLAALHAQAEEKERVLADFNGDGGIFKGAANVEAVEALGGKAAKIDQKNSLKTEAPGREWNSFTHLSFDAFNPNDVPVRLHLCLKDNDAPHGYYSWINRYVAVAPGKHTVEFQISALRRGEGSPKDSLDPRPFKWDQMTFAWLTGLDARPVFVNNLRLKKAEMKTFAELRAFHFSPQAAGVPFLGFVEVTPQTLYTAERGHGWAGRGANYARRRVNPPDELAGSWCSDENAVFRLDLPNGNYEGWAIMEDPGEWELYQNFTQRSLTVNGQIIVDEKMTGKDFLDRYFHFAEVEDQPNDSVWERYIVWRYPQRAFTFSVANGKADFNIRGANQYAATLNTIAVWPQAQAAEGNRFIADVNARRRQHLEKSWAELAPKKETLDPALAARYQAQGYIPFQRSCDRDIGYYDAPRVGRDPISPHIELQAAAAWGQSEPLQLAVHALRDLHGLLIRPGAFKAASGDALPAAAFHCGFVNYKFKRIGFSGAGQYGVVPFIVKPFAAGASTSAKNGTARQFFVTVTVPDGQKAGTYTGNLLLSAQGAPDLLLPASVTVLPFKLPDAGLGLGFFGTHPAPWSAYGFPENQARLEADFLRIMADLRAHGVTLLDVGALRFNGFKDGRAVWDTAEPEQLAKAAREAGFSHLYMHPRADGRLNEIAQDPAAAARKHGFADGAAILKAVYGSVNELCKQRGLPEPLFTFGDEPDTKPEIERLLAMYASVRQAGAHGYICYSTTHELTQPLLDVLRVSSLNVASLADMQRAQKAGNHIWLNNQGRSRWAYGVYMWKAHAAGVEACQQFIYIGTHADPYYPLDSFEDDGGMVYPDREGNLRPVVAYERIRQGINDYRTLKLLQTLCEKAGDKGKDAWAPVGRILDGLRFEDTGRDRRAQLSEAQLNELRALAAAGILALSK